MIRFEITFHQNGVVLERQVGKDVKWEYLESFREGILRVRQVLTELWGIWRKG